MARSINTILSLRDRMSGGLLRAARNTRTVDREMRSATQSVVRFAAKSKTAIGGVIKSTAKLGASTAGMLAGLGAATGFSEALNLEGYKLQLETATKDTQKAGQIMQYAINLANKTPFEGGELVEGAAKFEAMGMSAETWLARAGDMAAATNKGFDQAVEALIDAQTGELERLKEFGITKARILERGEKMFAGVQIVNNQGQITNQEKFNAAMIALMEDRFAGGMEKQASTFKGLWSTVTGITKSGLATMVGITTDGSIRSGSALSILKDKVSLLADRFQQWQQDGTLDSLAQKFDQGVAKGAQLASQGLAWLKDHGDSLILALKVLGGTIIGLKLAKLTLDTVNTIHQFALFAKTTWLVTSAAGANAMAWARNTAAIGLNRASILAHTAITKAAAIGTTVLTGAQTLLNTAFLASPIGWVCLGIMALVAAGVLLWKNWDKVKAAAVSLWEKITTVFGGIRDSIIGAFDSVKQTVGGVFRWIKEKLSWVHETISSIPVIGDLYTGFNSAVGKTAKHISGHATGTSYFAGGLTRVNERGGEILNLPGGTQIIPHDISKRMGGPSVNVQVTVQGNVIGNAAYADSLGETIAQRILAALGNM